MGPIGSAVLTFIGYKQTNKQIDRQAKFIYRWYKKEKRNKVHVHRLGSLDTDLRGMRTIKKRRRRRRRRRKGRIWKDILNLLFHK